MALSPRVAHVGLAILAFVAAGFSLVWQPAATVLVVPAAAALALLLGTRRPVLVALLALLVAQEPLLVLVGEGTTAGRVVKYADELLVLLAGAGALLLVTEARAVLRRKSLLLAVGGCYLGMLASSVVAGTALLPAGLDLALFSKPFLLFAVGLTIAFGEGPAERGIRAVALAMAAVLASGALFILVPELQEAYLGGVRPLDQRLGVVSAQGLFLGPGLFSWFAMGTFCLCYAGYLTYRRMGYLLAGGVAAALVVLAWRRKSILGLAVVLLAAVVARSEPRRRLRAVAVAACGALLAGTLLFPYLATLWHHTVQEYGGIGLRGTAREALYSASVEIARDRFPLGTGLASFGSYASELYYSDVYREYGLSQIYGLSPADPHYITDTFWPMVLGQGGVVSLASFAAFLALLISAAWRRQGLPSIAAADRFLSLWALFLLVASLTESMASHVYGSSLHAALVMIPAGMLWRRAHEEGLEAHAASAKAA